MPKFVRRALRVLAYHSAPKDPARLDRPAASVTVFEGRR